MTDIVFTEGVRVKTTRVEGDDIDIALAAWVSTKGDRVEDEADYERVAGLNNFLLRDRHGSPFEQVGFQFLVSAPIFVWREHMRHRIASYNEQSGRYMEMTPEFYLPNDQRNLVQSGKAGAYIFSPGTTEQYEYAIEQITTANEAAWQAYQNMLAFGIAKEVARIPLPLNLFSTAYVRMNLRALMNFLSLRTKSEDALFPSYPQREIELVAEQYELAFEEHFPLTYAAFVKNKRVAP